MRVNVMFVHMSADDKSVFSLCQRHGEVITDLICPFRGNLPRFEGLPQVVGNHFIVLLFPADNSGILPLGKKKLLVNNRRIALVGCDQIAAVRFLWIFHIVCHSAQGLGNAPSLAAVQGY